MKNSADSSRALWLESLEIRSLTLQDIPFIVEIDSKSNDPSWTEGMFKKELDLEISLNIVTLYKDQTIGFVSSWLVEGELQINQLAVAPEFRKKGVGVKMLDCLLGKARIQGAKKALLEFKEGNSPAEGFYQKMGFKKVGKRKGFYHTDQKKDAVLMECDL